MRFKVAGMMTALTVLTVGGALAQGPGAGKRGPAPPAFRVMNSSWTDGGEVPAKYSAVGGSTSPGLSWTNVPMGTVTFAILFHDPDVALNKSLNDVTHWFAFNIPASVTKLDEGAPLPEGAINGKNIRGQNAYMGPGAPANGPFHHYTLELFALDTKLDLTADAQRADFMKAIDGHILGKAVWVGLYHQPAPAQ